MKKVLLCAAIVSLVVSGAVPLHAQGKIKIAIWDFENHASTSWWFWNDMGPAARNEIDTAFSEDPTLSRTFSVVEREKLALVLKEQGLSTTGAVDPQTAAKVGRLLGVKYIVTGGIDQFSINKTSGGIQRFGGVGGNLVQADATIDMRFIDTTTAERVLSLSADGEVKKGGGFFQGNTLSRDSEWGIASEALKKASGAVVRKLAGGTYLETIATAATTGRGLEGKVIKVDGTRAWINLGSSAGIKAGDTFRIFSVGEELTDPDTGAKLGAEETESGTAQVTEVQDKFAVVTFRGTAKAKDVVRKQ
jgi:curli biogenesis system outer membrane secretion channel CsgG